VLVARVGVQDRFVVNAPECVTRGRYHHVQLEVSVPPAGRGRVHRRADPATYGLQPLALAAACLVAIALTVSCGGGDDADGSDGFERFEEDGLAVEYPAS
jgi:hypothetical protein